MIQIEFYFGKEVAVNVIIGIPTLKQWEARSALKKFFLTHPFFKHNFILFINMLTLGYLPVSPLPINNSSDLESLYHQVNPGNKYELVCSQHKL